MRTRWSTRLLGVLCSLIGFGICVAANGCGAAGSAFEYLGTPFLTYVGQQAQSGPTTTGRQSGAALQTGSQNFTDPCLETTSRKLVRISMRNQSTDYVHYFLILIAYVNTAERLDGGLCAADVPLYTSFGYTYVRAGESQTFGNLCIEGPAVYYFHRGGQFRSTGGSGQTTLASAIAPAQGSTPTYDATFTSAGLTVPIPDRIIFHNPGTTTGGRALKISVNSANPCNVNNQNVGDPNCEQDGFYYVDEDDRIAGSTALGAGSGRRVPSDVQGTSCECQGTSDPAHQLAPSGLSGLNAFCYQFFRGGRIDFVFVRDDTDPPYPQLLWRVTDAAGARAHDYDPRSSIR